MKRPKKPIALTPEGAFDWLHQIVSSFAWDYTGDQL